MYIYLLNFFCKLILFKHLKYHAQDRLFIHRADVMKTDIGAIWEEAGASKCDWNDQVL